MAEVFLKQKKIHKCEEVLETVEETDPRDDFFVLGNIQRIRGKIALNLQNEELAEHHFKRALTIFETGEDLFQTALMHYLIGRTIGIEKKDEAIKHLLAAGETFRALGVTNLHEKSESLISDIKSYSNTISDENKRKQTDNAGSQLLMVRLAEATASRELLFRELVAVLRLDQAVSELETQMITDALRRHDWHISRTAKELGLTRRDLYMKIERYKIERAA